MGSRLTLYDLRKVFLCWRQYNLRRIPWNVHPTFLQKKFLGFFVQKIGIDLDQAKAKAIRDMKPWDIFYPATVSGGSLDGFSSLATSNKKSSFVRFVGIVPFYWARTTAWRPATQRDMFRGDQSTTPCSRWLLYSSRRGDKTFAICLDKTSISLSFSSSFPARIMLLNIKISP